MTVLQCGDRQLVLITRPRVKTHLMASFMDVPVVSSWMASFKASRSLGNAACAASPSSSASGFADTLRLGLPAPCSS